MTKTATATGEPRDRKKEHLCPTCNTEMKYDRKSRKWLCPSCLYGAFLSDQAQREAVKRYRQSEKGIAAEKKYEQSDKGKAARERYLKSDKYKQRRREYNQRLKESLAIARAAMLPRAKAITREEKLVPLINDIREFIATSKRAPLPSDVVEWAENEYQARISEIEAETFIKRAQKSST
ncbi:hypothetical protein KKE60_05065 [Patescibacteria group bacterium]|nr:hypothetical protein [Patescibacteria group bacterium]